MTGVPATPRGSVGRRGARSPNLSRPVNPGTFLIALLVFGLLLRLFIAGPYLPFSGFRTDMVAYTGWAMRLADTGPAGFYATGYFSDYPPGYMYVLWGLGSIGQAFEPFFGVDITRGLVKLPGIFADVGVAALLFALCKRFAGQLLPGATDAVGARLGLVAGAVYLLNPGVIFNSAVWGQIDSVGSLILLGTVYLLARGWTEAAAVTAVLALLVKFQFAFLIPVVAVVGLKRHLFGRSTDPAHDERSEPLRVLTSLGAGVVTLVFLIIPFGMTIWAPGEPAHSLIGKFVEAANTYTGLTVNALNPWRLPFTGATGPFPGYGDTLHGGTDTTVLFGLGGLDVTAQIIGAALFAAAALLALWQVARRDDVLGVLLAGLLLAVAFFVLPTRVHERYLFPALVLAAPLVLRSPRWAALYAALSAFFLANVYWVYTADWSFVQDVVINPGAFGAPMARDPFLASTLFSDAGVYVLSAAVALPLAWIAWRALAVARSPQTDADAAPLQLAAEPPPKAVEAAPPPVRAAPASVHAIGSDDPPRQPWWDRFGWMRTDPDDPLLREPGRRLDRLDAALVLGLVVLALAFRLWHLDVPRGMHFDEVYHARSASEWLADWQQGWRRDVYEWTHPMLAKYLIAAGIVVADPNKVTDEQALDAPAPTLTVAPQRSSLGFDRSIAFSAGSGDEVVAHDLESDSVVVRWSAGGPVTALAYDDESVRLLVGLASSGAVATYDLKAFLAADGERAPPIAGVPIESGLEAVSEILVPRDGDMILLRSQEGLASVERVTGAALASSELLVGGIGYLPSDADTPALAAVTDPSRNAILLLDAATLAERNAFDISPRLIGPLITRGSGTDQQVFALTGTVPANAEHAEVAGGLAVVDADQNQLVDVVPLPGAARAIGWQPVANIVYAAGTEAGGEPALWTILPHGESRRETSAGFAPFDATRLPGEPLALAFDVSRHAQEDDAADLLVSTAAADGARLVTVDAGSNAFAWRLAGVVVGSLLVGLVYLLAATMFSRRRIAVLAAAFVAFDGMSLVMSRIAMNDIFVAVFIVAAYLVFWQVWSGRWARSAWWALPMVGVLIGLAAASKWVGFYALAGLWVLTLARSELGRLVLVAAIAFLAVVAGLGAPWPFTVVVVAALALALLLVYRRPIRLDVADLTGLAGSIAVLAGLGVAFGLAYDSVPGREPRSAVETLFAVLARGAEAGWPVLLMLGIGAALIAVRGVRSLLDPESDRRWYQPGELGGFGWAWIGAALLIVPLTVYGLSYLPYLQLGHTFALPDTGPGYQWSLDELHSQMFGYHYGLTASHAAAAPWWSWPLDLKTTWFFSGDYDGQRAAVIYNGGNPLLFWAGVPAIVVCGVLAWRRRSLALVLLVVAFAFQFLPWTRIERATFIYHYLTAVLFAMVAVAYFADELLRRPQLRELGVAYLAATVVAGILIFPLGWALPMPDWYINAARSLPPWNYYFVFPDPPQGERAELVAADTARLVLGLVLSAAAVVFALVGRDWLERRRRPTDDEEVGEPATEAG